MKHVYLVRHAESEANTGARFGDPKEIRLSPQGEQEANQLAERVSSVDTVIVSPYRRTQDTAMPLIEKHHIKDVPVWEQIFEFTYLDPRKFIDITREEKDRLTTAYWERMDPDYRDGGSAESFSDLLNRVRESIGRMAGLHGESYIFTHGGFIRTFLLLCVEFPHLLARGPSAEDQERALMRRYHEVLESNEIPVVNTQIIEVTQLIADAEKRLGR